MLHWTRSRRDECVGSVVNNYIQQFINDYKAEYVMIGDKNIVADATYIVEVWYNFRGRKNIVVTFVKPESYDEDDDSQTVF